ncbi:hypothetical protein A2160_01365 [Candidatus Beckwithbacteria bacterium RBG_13_42_9]|uniref:Elongation factor 4 n=1 Tax=Candidatus Beckwithbacteria bacterium RBG_13_42_9 TaxID=1797457 RepID=A0A1F5E4F1_9BACT|nr:MAG: hypothetical protein A2160_01365 [Candidatus Beckwithbacteria bacterium RBG_13_42_9]
MKTKNIRNFCIIAHIDHGKSTLCDRLLELTKTIDQRHMQAQVLDTNPISRERGITIKLAPVRMLYKARNPNIETRNKFKIQNSNDKKNNFGFGASNFEFSDSEYILNLIDTPGHVDFAYEVSRSLAACEGAILLVDAMTGVQAQTMSVYRQARELGLKLIPVVNKIDLPAASPEDVALDMIKLFGFNHDEILFISAKTGQGVKELLEAIIERIPAPKGKLNQPLRALVFDSHYDTYLGTVANVRVVDGELDKKELILMANRMEFSPVEVGIFNPQMQATDRLSCGEVGYVATGLKSVALVKVGDTITESEKLKAKSEKLEALPGYKEPKPMVFLGIYPVDSQDFPDLKEALEKLHLNDAAFSYSEEFSQALGKGYRCGFAGLLHAEVVQERLEREFNLDLIASVPNVAYEYEYQGKRIKIQTASQLPDLVDKVFEPWTKLEIFTPQTYMGGLMELLDKRRGKLINMEYLTGGIRLIYEMPLAELITDFFDRLKSVSSGFASLDYEIIDYRQVVALRLDILVHHEKVDALSQVVVKDKAQLIGKEVALRLKKVIPRQLFEVAVQAAIGGTIVARETIKPFRKDVTAKLYGGDQTRKDKLLKKQKKGKKRMKQIGRVIIPQEAFLAVLKRN